MPEVFNLFRRMPSASGERQMLPVQTNRMFTKVEVNGLQFYPFVELFNKLPELFIRFHEVVHRAAGVKHRGMVLIPAMQANAGQGRLRMFL